MNNNNLIIEEILRGDDATLRALYPRYQAVFMKHIGRSWANSFEEAILLDAYLEAMANFYIRVKTKKLTHLKYTVESYLISTGHYLLIKEAKRQKKILPLESLPADPIDEEQILFDTKKVEVKDKEKNHLLEAVSQLGKKCRQVLNLYFWEKKDPEEIRDIMGYANIETLYVVKSKCMKKLKDLLKK